MKHFILFMILMLPTISYASHTDDYVNSNGVSISSSDYKLLSEVYTKEYVDAMSKNRYSELQGKTRDDFEYVEYYDNEFDVTDTSTIHSTTYKTLKIIKDSNNNITLLLNWKLMPSTRSYDVFGIRFYNCTLNGNINYLQYYVDSSGNSHSSTVNHQSFFSNGFGTSFLLPAGNLKVLQHFLDFKVSGSGIIYGAYQHAQSNVSLSNSMNYTISSSGYGNVLLFASSISGYYDAMSGVNISI